MSEVTGSYVMELEKSIRLLGDAIEYIEEGDMGDPGYYTNAHELLGHVESDIREVKQDLFHMVGVIQRQMEEG